MLLLKPLTSLAFATTSRVHFAKRHSSCFGRIRLHAAQSMPSAPQPEQSQQRPQSVIPQMHESFAEIVDLYDAFILDQFGVLHDGVTALPGAVACVEFLAHEHGKQLIILSNTSAPSQKALEKLPKLGFDGSYFVGAVTSGEEASKYIKSTLGSDPEKAAKAVFWTWDIYKPDNARLTAPPQAFLDQCGNVEIATTIDEANFLLLHGSEIWYTGGKTPEEATFLDFVESGNMDTVEPLLRACVNRGLPMVCANPDVVVQTPCGGTAYMPGGLATRYAEMGGTCRIFGKPDVEHFEACLRALDVPRSKVAHVGDSLHHDIAGANAANIPNVLVTSGIHRSGLGTNFGVLPSDDKVTDLCQREGNIFPTHVVSAFRI
jgi:ribonucleotide monophosphatase NagD (HAD superfamily)